MSGKNEQIEKKNNKITYEVINVVNEKVEYMKTKGYKIIDKETEIMLNDNYNYKKRIDTVIMIKEENEEYNTHLNHKV